MKRNITSVTPETKGANMHLSRSPMLFAVMIMTIWTARWIWIIRDNSDFGITYEASARVAAGEIWGQDFFVTVPPVSYYTEAIFFWALHGSVWSENVHLFFWWILSISIGACLAKALKVPKEVLITGILLATAISTPAANCGLAYNYVASSWIGLAALLVVSAINAEKLGWATPLCGILLGISILTKHNIGILMTGFFGFSLIYIPAGSRTRPRQTIFCALMFYGLGVCLGFVLPLWLLARHSSFSNLIQLLLKDGVSGKGGFAVILIRTIPRFVFSDLKGSSFERIVEAGVSVAVMCVIVCMTYRWRRRTVPLETSRTEASPRFRRSLAFALATLLAFSLLSFGDFPSIRWFGSQLAGSLGVRSLGLGNFNGQICYMALIGIIGTLLASFVLPKRFAMKHSDRGDFLKLRPVEFFLYAFCLFCSFSAATSNINYFPFVAPLTIPLLICVLYRYMAMPLHVMHFVSATFTALLFLWPGYGETFTKYKPLPANSPFQGLWAGPIRWREIDHFWTAIHPLVQGKRTLWLTECGPESAYGGKLVPSVTGFGPDTYGSRIEPLLKQKWEAELPERVVRGFFLPPAGSLLLVQSAISQWLVLNYYCEYQGEGFEVWSKKE